MDRAWLAVVTSWSIAIAWWHTDLREDVDQQDHHFGH